jgi:hypothetical protein
LGDVFGGLGAVAAFLFSSTLLGLSGGVAGQGAASGAGLALLATVVGITGTVLVQRRTRTAGVLCLGAGLLGTTGTFAFLLASLLYVIAGGLAFFAPPLASASVGASTPPAARRLHMRLPVVALPRRSVAIAGALVLVLLATIGGSVLAQPAEQQPVRALLDGLQKSDDIALAKLLAPGLRAGKATADAQAVVAYALGRSEIGFLNADWLRRLGPTTGTKMVFEDLTVSTVSKSADTAVVHARGLFAPTNENALIRLLLQGLRQPFDADIALLRADGTWYVTNPVSATATPAPLPQPAASVGPSSAAPARSVVPTPLSAVRHLALGTYAVSGTVTDINGWRLTLSDVTVNVDESLLFEFDLNVGTVDYAWAGRESRLDLRGGGSLGVVASRSVFYDGGKGPGTLVHVALAFPPGLAGNQPYVIRVCGNLGYCWQPVPGPALGER